MHTLTYKDKTEINKQIHRRINKKTETKQRPRTQIAAYKIHQSIFGDDRYF